MLCLFKFVIYPFYIIAINNHLMAIQFARKLCIADSHGVGIFEFKPRLNLVNGEIVWTLHVGIYIM